jgi:hypothetical protein
MTTIERTIDVDASAEAVWQVLVDFESYPEWNPFVTMASGAVAEGERLRVRIEPPAGRAMTFKPIVTAVVDGERLEWLGRLGVPGLFDGRHEFVVESLGTKRARFTQRESFSGLLVRVLLDADDVAAGFDAMNEALKRRVADPASRARAAEDVQQGA